MVYGLCGCKGIRTCALCENNTPTTMLTECLNLMYCDEHCAASPLSCSSLDCKQDVGFPFPGVRLFKNFIDTNEELYLVNEMDKDTWTLSQSGRRKQDYGPKVNFKRQRVQMGRFTGLPAYSKFIMDRLNKILISNGQIRFNPVELCNLEYLPDRGASIVPHLDDSWLWGDRLITLNLCSPTYLTFCLPDSISEDNKLANSEMDRLRSYLDKIDQTSKDNQRVNIRVLLEPRSLVIVEGLARQVWLHEIKRSDIQSRRIAMTFRELSDLFLPSNKLETWEQEIGKQLLELSNTYCGTICNS